MKVNGKIILGKIINKSGILTLAVSLGLHSSGLLRSRGSHALAEHS